MDKDLSISDCCIDLQPHISRDSCFNWLQLIVCLKGIPRAKKNATVASTMVIISTADWILKWIENTLKRQEFCAEKSLNRPLSLNHLMILLDSYLLLEYFIDTLGGTVLLHWYNKQQITKTQITQRTQSGCLVRSNSCEYEGPCTALCCTITGSV